MSRNVIPVMPLKPSPKDKMKPIKPEPQKEIEPTPPLTSRRGFFIMSKPVLEAMLEGRLPFEPFKNLNLDLVKLSYDAATENFTVEAVSPLFEVRNDGALAPEYRITFTKDLKSDGFVTTAQRVVSPPPKP